MPQKIEQVNLVPISELSQSPCWGGCWDRFSVFQVLLAHLLVLLNFETFAAEVSLWPPAVKPENPPTWVNPMIGTGGITFLCGNNFPGATVPFGMVRLSPDTVTPKGGKASNMSGYYYGDQHLLGFSHTRLVGTGAVDGGNFLVIPAVTKLTEQSLRQEIHYQFSHEQELAFPGYYAVLLPEPQIVAELTASTRVGVHRYTFPAGRSPHLQIHVSSALGKGRAAEGQVQVSEGRMEVQGSVRTFGSFSSRYGGAKVYFVARFNQPVAGHSLWANDQLLGVGTSAEGERVGVELQFSANDQPTILEMQLGLSYVSIDNARNNLMAEAGERTFDEVLAKAKSKWHEKLGLVNIEGGSASQRTCFYTALYRSLNMPTAVSDCNGQYLGFDKQVHQTKQFTYYTDMSLWDTFRTTHPLYALLLPLEQRDMVVSLVEMSRQGGYLPRWPSGSGYTNSMFGTPADLVIAETYLKGIRDFDIQAAYQAIQKTAMATPPKGAPFSGREGIEEYIQHGYCPYDLMPESVARTLEYCHADFAIARLAEALGYSQDALLFDQRAQNYRNLWNPETHHFQPRDSKGQFFADFRPKMLTYTDATGKYTGAYVEGSALQWRWAVPHDSAGLISLFPSRENFVEQLEEFFSKSIPRVGAVPNAYYWQGNQPDLYAAFHFNSAGRPDLTQKWVRWILEHKYGDGANGLDGNDDGGTLSAWYVFAALGLYPIAGTDRYELASPIWSRAELTLGNKRLVILSDSAAVADFVPTRAVLNGKEVDGTQVSHSQLLAGGELRFERMVAKP